MGSELQAAAGGGVVRAHLVGLDEFEGDLLTYKGLLGRALQSARRPVLGGQ
jgi:hypothetical protein